MTYEPPDGMTHFVWVLQRAAPGDAADLLRLAFDNAAAGAIVDDLRLRRAAPALLAACKVALDAIEQHHPIDWTQLSIAITAAEPSANEALPHA